MAPGPVPLPPAGSAYWGAWQEGAPWDMGIQARFEADAGKGASLVHFGVDWGADGADFPTATMTTVRDHGAIPLLDWGSWAPGDGGTAQRYRPRDIAAGRYDAYLRRFAGQAKDWGQPFFLRFDHEMNIGGQFPWNYADPATGNSAADYVLMWQHVHDVFQQVGATNVAWVWCPNAYFPAWGQPSFSPAYPGDAYVDWVGFDSYNQDSAAWLTARDILSPSYAELQRIAPTKPIMLGELGSREGEAGQKAAWLRDMFRDQLPTAFPAIRAVAWFNWDFGGGTNRIESSPSSLAAFREAVGQNPYYLPNRSPALGTAWMASPLPGTVGVNAGGDAYTGAGGRLWDADTGFSGGKVSSTPAAIAGTMNPALYQSERWGRTFSYSFDALPDGDYTVILKFAETYWTQPGQRVFNVAINGQSVLKNFDILAQVAPNTAHDETFPVTVTDGTLTITFAATVDAAKVSAITILPAGPGDMP